MIEKIDKHTDRQVENKQKASLRDREYMQINRSIIRERERERERERQREREKLNVQTDR